MVYSKKITKMNLYIKNSQIKIDNLEKNYFDYKNYSNAIKELENNYGFIKKLISSTKYKQNFLSNKQFTSFIYHFFLYYLLNWSESRYHKKLHYLSWHTIINFLKKNKKKFQTVELDYSNGNLDLIAKYYTNMNLKVSKKNNPLTYNFFWYTYRYFLFLGFLSRLFFYKKNEKSKLESDSIFVSNYDRYYKNKNYFSEEFIKSKLLTNFLEKEIHIKPKKSKVLYLKYNPRNLSNYIKRREHDFLFLEDFLEKKIFFKFLFKKNPKLNLKNDYRPEDIKWYLVEAYNMFLKNEFKFLFAHYLSIENNMPKNISFVISDIETNLFFYSLLISKKIRQSNLNLISFSHDTISNISSKLTFSIDYSIFPDFKLVWDSNGKDLLVKKYDYPPNKIKIFPDPRFLYWQKFSMKPKSILLLSTLEEDYYNKIISLGKNPFYVKLVKKGYFFFFKPHPIELGNAKKVSKLNELCKIEGMYKIESLDFIPEYVVGNISIMLYELYQNGSTPFFYSKDNIFNFEESYFRSQFSKDLNSALNSILDKFKKG